MFAYIYLSISSGFMHILLRPSFLAEPLQCNKEDKLVPKLKLKVVLRIVCLVPVFLAPKVISYMSRSDCSLRILKTLHLVLVRWSSVSLQWCNASRIGASSVRSRDHWHSYVNHVIPNNQKHSSGWLSPTENETAVVKCNCHVKVPKYCNP